MSFIERTLRELKKSTEILKEAYDFDERDEELEQDNEVMPDDDYNEENEYVDGENIEGQDLSQQDDRIARIREVALEGLQEYADKVDSEIYQFYKKIWLMCDKAVSEKDNSTVG